MYPNSSRQHRIRRVLPRLTLIALTSGLLPAHAQDRFASVQVEAQPVNKNIYMLTGAGGNIGVSVGVDGTLIIDDQYSPLGEKILAALERLGGSRPKIILNTHFHGDHTGSNPLMGSTGTIIAHDNVRARLLAMEEFPRAGLPLVTYEEQLKVHFNDDELTLLHLPGGHTDGDSVVWFKRANVIHMGDHFFKNRFPYIDVASGGSIDGFIANVTGLIAKLPQDIHIIPGHGALANLQELRENIAVIEATSGAIRNALQAGEDVAGIAARIDQQYPGWGSGFISAERWVGIVQADLTAAQ